MKKDSLQKRRILSKVSALFFLMLMLAAIGLQSFFHDHCCEHSIVKSQGVHVLAYHNDECPVCDQIHYRHNYDVSTPEFNLPHVLPTHSAHSARYYIGFYKFTLQGFTNKGPPVYIS